MSYWSRNFLLVVVLILINTNLAIAQETNPNNSSDEPGCPPADAPVTKVTDVYREVNISPQGTPPTEDVATLENTLKVNEVELGDVITLEVQNLTTLLDEAECTGKQIVLYLDERPLKDVTAYPPTNPTQPMLKFPLKRTESSRDEWTYVLGAPILGSRVTKVSMGIEDRFAVPSDATINLKVIPPGWFTFWLILFVLILAGFLLLAWKSDVLRDTVPPLGGEMRKPFSLARTQAAWWFFLIFASYLFIGMITGDFSTTITGTVLGLLGISAGTVVGSAIIDVGKSNPVDLQRQEASKLEIERQQTELETVIRDLQNKIQMSEAEIRGLKDSLRQNPTDAIATEKNLIEKQRELGEKQKELAEKQAEKTSLLSRLKKSNNQSENILLDILSDTNGVSFHRFQIAAWTVVLGIIFIVQVYKVLAMPTFDGSLLTLLGISAGTYLGLKIPEGKGPGA